MDWTTQQHSGERLIEWGAPAVLAAAVGWATSAVSEILLAGAGAAAVVLAVGVWAMRRADVTERGPTLPEYAIEPIDAATSDELLLDDPLGEVAADARVVSMFEREAEDEAATPGALVTRIADYLGDRGPRARTAEDHDEARMSAEAGAALQAALANIRASLH